MEVNLVTNGGVLEEGMEGRNGRKGWKEGVEARDGRKGWKEGVKRRGRRKG